MNAPKKLLVATIAAVGIVAASGAAIAQRGGGGHGERMIERVSERLELDDNQRAAITTLADEMRETRELMRGTDGDLRAQVESLVTADTLDQGAALTLIQRRTASMNAQAPELVAAAAAFLDGLDAEQKADVAEFLEKRGGHGRRGRGGDRD